MKRTKVDLSGEKYGLWTVIRKGNGRQMGDRLYPTWFCKCSCGTEREVLESSLKRGRSQSCGCINSRIKYLINDNKYELDRFEYGICYVDDKEVLFDLEDYENISKYKWKIVKTNKGYQYVVSNKNREKIIMSRLIMNCNDLNVQVDHINHNTFDNRKSNLRVCTSSQNNMNKPVRKDNTSGYTGVYINKKTNRYISHIKVNGNRIHLGTFRNIDDAIKARKEAEVKYFKSFRYKK